MLPSNWENLSLCFTEWIHVRKTLPSCRQRKYLIEMFVRFWAWFLRFFFYVFPEAPVSCDKKYIGLICTTLYFNLYELKKRVSDFKNLISNWRYQHFCPLRCLFLSAYAQLRKKYWRKIQSLAEVGALQSCS